MQPPLSMISSCIQDGKLSLRLMKVRISPMAPPCTVQVSWHLPKAFKVLLLQDSWQRQGCTVKRIMAPAIASLEMDYLLKRAQDFAATKP